MVYINGHSSATLACQAGYILVWFYSIILEVYFYVLLHQYCFSVIQFCSRWYSDISGSPKSRHIEYWSLIFLSFFSEYSLYLFQFLYATIIFFYIFFNNFSENIRCKFLFCIRFPELHFIFYNGLILISILLELCLIKVVFRFCFLYGVYACYIYCCCSKFYKFICFHHLFQGCSVLCFYIINLFAIRCDLAQRFVFYNFVHVFIVIYYFVGIWYTFSRTFMGYEFYI